MYITCVYICICIYIYCIAPLHVHVVHHHHSHVCELTAYLFECACSLSICDLVCYNSCLLAWLCVRALIWIERSTVAPRLQCGCCVYKLMYMIMSMDFALTTLTCCTACVGMWNDWISWIHCMFMLNDICGVCGFCMHACVCDVCTQWCIPEVRAPGMVLAHVSTIWQSRSVSCAKSQEDATSIRTAASRKPLAIPCSYMHVCTYIWFRTSVSCIYIYIYIHTWLRESLSGGGGFSAPHVHQLLHIVIYVYASYKHTYGEALRASLSGGGGSLPHMSISCCVLLSRRSCQTHVCHDVTC